MKKTLALLVIPMATLTGCARYDNPRTSDSYYCRQIVHQMHAAPDRYKGVGGNKHLATTQAKLQKDYHRYDCDLYKQGGKSK